MTDDEETITRLCIAYNSIYCEQPEEAKNLPEVMRRAILPIIKADRAELVAEIVAELRDEDERLTRGGALTDASHLADHIEAKFGGDNGQRHEY